MWDGGGIKVCGGDFVKLGENKKRKDMIANRNSNLGFTVYDSIHEIKINMKANSFIFFIKIIQ